MQIHSMTATVFAANCLIISRDQRALVVDPGAGTAGRIRHALADTGKELTAVLLTHGHPDHVWEAAAVAGEEVPVYISEPDAPFLAGPAGAPGTEGDLRFAELAGGPWQPPAHVVTYSPGDVITPVDGIELRTIAAPGHSPGSMLAVMSQPAELHGPMGHPQFSGPQHMVLTGDVIFAGAIGRTDLPGSDPQAMRQTLLSVPQQLPADSLLLPGHGPATWLRHERATNPFLLAPDRVG